MQLLHHIRVIVQVHTSLFSKSFDLIIHDEREKLICLTWDANNARKYRD